MAGLKFFDSKLSLLSGYLGALAEQVPPEGKKYGFFFFSYNVLNLSRRSLSGNQVEFGFGVSMGKMGI